MNKQEVLTKIYLIRGSVGLSTEVRIVDLAHSLTIIDKLSSDDAWSQGMYLEELNSAHAVIFVLADHGTTGGDFKGRDRSSTEDLPEEYPLQVAPPILGFCCMRTLFEVSEIRNIVVHPKFQGKGFGTALLELASSEARRSGAGELTLEVREGNLRARNLYQKLNFKEVGKRSGYYRNNNEGAIIMTRILAT